MLVCANGSGIFELQVLEIANPRSELKSGDCCGDGVRSPVTGRCSTSCNTFFRLCLKEYQSNVTSTGSCSFGSNASQVLGRDSFTLSDPERGRLVLPFTFRWTLSEAHPCFQTNESLINSSWCYLSLDSPMGYQSGFGFQAELSVAAEFFEESNDTSAFFPAAKLMVARITERSDEHLSWSAPSKPAAYLRFKHLERRS
ncbi:unnamed protein product [Brassicogethes aeneus]|uniref:Notch ligand N-terminal domain-containing protein n=1 Tax=Brassicogethes aeneus TaxID=1431903 RepID=A0A9P0FE26_BRAAE|nr:unnamed protein product [Brassicogethes aeneus]